MVATTGHRSRFAIGLMILSTLGLSTMTGCGNPKEGTVQVSPEARARLRGGQAPQLPRGKTKGAPVIDVREKQRQKPEG